MRRRRVVRESIVIGLVVLALGLLPSCRRAPEAPEDAPAQAPPADLGRDDMAALPGANVDLVLLREFPYFLRQESSMPAEEVFAFYDEFFSGRGWTVETSVDPISQALAHSYRLGDELAFVTVAELPDGRNEVVLSRRTARQEERSGTEG